MITLNELLKLAETKKVAIHATTEDQAKVLLRELDKSGYEWASRDKLTTETYYGDYKQNTCYTFGKSGWDWDNEVTYRSLDFYQKEGYTIIECGDIDFEEEK